MSTPTAVADAELAKILRDNEDYILSVTKSKAVDLSEKMFQRCVISESMMDQFSSLDHSRVEPQLQLRYLLRLVRKGIQQDGSVGDKFVSLLESLKEHKMCEIVRMSGTEKDMEPTKAEGEGLYKSLTTDDISWMLEILAEASYKWEMLGVALGLPTYQIKNIKGDDNVKNLWRVLDVWLSGEGKSPLNVCTLINALRSKTVGQGRLAQEIEEKFKSLETPKTGFCSSKTDTSKLALTITNQSCREVKVDDNKSTLLLVQSSHRENVSYQWNKNGRPLTDNHTYSGVQDNILIINHAHQGTGGEYTCIVRNQEKEAISNKVTLTVLYPPEKKALLDLYSVNTRASLDNAWPPVGAEIFINLVLVKSSQQLDTNLTKLLDRTEKIEYDEVFGSFRSAALILVEGRPGSGKTTLVHKLISDWAKGNALIQAKLVFLVSLRILTDDALQSDTLFTLLERLYPNAGADLVSLVSDIEKKSGEGACFVFDGLDEYHPHLKDKSIVFRLLHKYYLPRAMIIVSSRPGAMERLRQEVVTKHIEVFGFSENEISEYIDTFPFTTTSDSSVGPDKLKEYLKLHPNVFHMCYLPIHAAIICFVYQTNRGHLPHTQTKIYDEFTRAMILRHLKRNDRKIQLFSLKELPNDTRDNFNKLCCLAFNMTVEHKQVINERDISFPFNTDTGHHGDWSLGLVTCSRTAQLYGVSTSYMFLHLTLQEYLAAYYIANTEEEDKYQLINGLISESFLGENMWTFYFGLESFESQEKLKIFRRMLDYSARSCIRYAFESQQQILCSEIVRLKHGTMGAYLTSPSDVTALVFVCCNTTQPIRTLFLSTSDSITDSVLQLMKHVKYPQLETLEIDTIRVLQHSMILESSPQLRSTTFHLTDVTVEEGKYLADKLKCLNHLKHLELLCSKHFVNKRCPGVTAFITGIHCVSQVRSLSLSFIMDLKCCDVLALNICQLINMEKLCLQDNSIHSDGAISLGWALRHLTNLEVLDMSYNNIGGDGTIALLSALHNCTKIRKLYLGNNNISSAGAICLTSKLHNLTLLKKLDLRGNKIGSDGAIYLASGLCHLSELNYLNLSGNGIDADSAIQVIAALKDCQKLTRVDFGKNTNMYRILYKGICLSEVVTSGDSATIDRLIDAIRLHKRDTGLYLGFRCIDITFKESCD